MTFRSSSLLETDQDDGHGCFFACFRNLSEREWCVAHVFWCSTHDPRVSSCQCHILNMREGTCIYSEVYRSLLASFASSSTIFCSRLFDQKVRWRIFHDLWTSFLFSKILRTNMLWVFLRLLSSSFQINICWSSMSFCV